MGGPRFYWGFRFTRRGLRPYAGVGWSWRLRSRRAPARQAYHKQAVIFHCSLCGHVNPPNAKFCNGCGAAFTLPPKIEYVK